MIKLKRSKIQIQWSLPTLIKALRSKQIKDIKVNYLTFFMSTFCSNTDFDLNTTSQNNEGMR